MKPNALKLTLLPALVLCLSHFAGATPIVIVGNHDLLPDTPGQPVPIFVSGGDLVEGLNFTVQIADGLSGPTITGDILTGTIFAGNNTGQQDVFSNPYLVAVSTTTDTGTVIADGLLGTVFVDTTGFFGNQVFALSMGIGVTTFIPTDFAGIPADITDGSITVPEPPTIVIALIAIASLGLVARAKSDRCSVARILRE